MSRGMTFPCNSGVWIAHRKSSLWLVEFGEEVNGVRYGGVLWVFGEQSLQPDVQ